MIPFVNQSHKSALTRNTFWGLMLGLTLMFGVLTRTGMPEGLSPHSHGLALLCSLAWLVFYTQTGAFFVTVQGLLASLYLYFFYTAWYSGAIHSIALDWISLLPACTLLLGWRSTLFWTSTSFVMVLAMLGATVWGVAPQATLLPHNALWAFVLESGVLIAFTTVIILYDAINARHMAELLRQKELLTKKQDELIKAQSHKDEFIAMISHEVKNPIHAILGFTDLMQHPMSPPSQRVISHIQEAAKQLLQVVSDILDFSQLQAKKVSLIHEEFDLNRWLMHLITRYTTQANHKNLRIQLSPRHPSPCMVTADRFRLEQILHQLISNAIKFSENGTITLHVSLNDNHFAIAVQDQGIGIAPNALEKIFADFEHASAEIQHRYGGTGLGLAICHQLALLHQGQIQATSQLGQGATFTITLPRQPTPSPESPHQSPPRKQRSPSPWTPAWQSVVLSLKKNWQSVSTQERIYLFFMQALFGGMVYFRWIAPTQATADVDDVMMMGTQLTSLLILLRVPFRPVVHVTHISFIAVFIYLSLHTGGVLSTSFVFGKLLMLIPLYVYARRAQLIWGVLILGIFGVIAWLTHTQQLPAGSHVLQEAIVWSLSSHMHLLGLTLFIPLVHKFNRKKTQRELIEQNLKLQETQQSLLRQHELKDQFISTISHAFRTPMNAIIGFIELLHDEAQTTADLLELHSMVNQSAHHLLTLIDDVLDQSQAGSGKIKLKHEVFDVHKTVGHAFQMFEAAQSLDHVTLTLAFENTPRWVLGDAQRLTQILVNLLSNALKYTRAGEIKLQVQRHEQGLRFDVKDTGEGISAEKLSQIFNRFEQIDAHTQRAKGHGLGLSITRRLVDSAHGWIEVQSQVGQGTTFSFWLPLPITSPPLQTAIATTQAKVSPLPMRFLIVDDQSLNRLLVRQVLQKEWPQCVCVEAENGKQAIEMLSQHPIDFVLMDVLMPEMDGIAATEHIRQQSSSPYAHLPILGLTANANQQTHDKCLQAGMDAVMFKPFHRQDLILKIQTHLQPTQLEPLAMTG